MTKQRLKKLLEQFADTSEITVRDQDGRHREIETIYRHDDNAVIMVRGD